MNNYTMIEQLAPSKSVLIRRIDGTTSGISRIWRAFTKARMEYMDDYVSYLKTYTDSKNASTASTTVDSPIIDGKVHAGIWFGGRVAEDWAPVDPGVQGSKQVFCVIQELIKGSYTSAGTIVENSCEFSVSRYYFQGVTARIAAPAKATGVTYSVGGESFDEETGTWSGWVESRTRLSQTATITSEVSAAGTVSRIIDKGASSITGISLTTGTIKRQTVDILGDCTKNGVTETETPTDQTATSVVSAADETSETILHTQAAAADPGAAVDGKIVEADNIPTPFGKFRTVIRTRTPVDQEATSVVSAADETAETILHTQAETADPGAAVDGKIVEADNTPTPFGKFRTVVRTRTPVDQEATSVVSAADETAETILHTQAETADPGAAVDGKIVEADNTPTPFGKFRTVVRTRTPVDQEATSVVSAADETAETVLHTQAETADPGAAVDGKIVEADNTPTPFGKFRTLVRTRTPVDQEATSVVSAADETSETVLHTQAETADPGAAVDGKIVEADNTPTPFGKFRTLVRTRTPVDQEATSVVSAADETEETILHTQAAAADPGTPVTGKIVEADNTPTPFGKFRTLVRTRTPVGLDTPSFTSKDSADESSTTEHHQNATSVPSASSSGPLVTQVIMGRLNSFGKSDYTKETITEKSGFGGVAGSITWTVKGESTVWRPASGLTVIVTYYYHHTKSLHTTAASAAAEITGGDMGSDWGRYSNGQWWAEKVVRNDLP